jgi:hypothetical protein
MQNHSGALFQLCECLRGNLPKRSDWTSLLGLANQTLTTPALIELVRRYEEEIPEDVCVYVRGMYQRNVMRSDRLAAQLAEAVRAMNGCGITPVLLKGTALLATSPRSRRGSRIMSDLDITVSPDQTETALNALFALGYTLHYQTPPHVENWHADLKRPSDVGMIDLQRSPPGPLFFFRPAGDVLGHCKLASIGGASAYVPSATYQALTLIIHEYFQDHDYWIGNMDLRHLLDLRDLAISSEGIDWERLVAFNPSKLAKNALESQLITLSALFAVDVPILMRKRFIPRLQHRRRMTQARFPLSRWPLLAMTMLDYGNYRNGPGLNTRAGKHVGRRWRALPKLSTLRWLLALCGEHRVGKA